MPVSYNPFTVPLRIRLNPSLRLAGFLLATHLGALIAIWLGDWPQAWSAVPWSLSVLILLHALRAVRRYWLFRDPDYPRAFVVFAWDVEYLDGRTGRILPSTFVHPWLTVIHLRLEDKTTIHLPIVRDALDPDTFRHLRVRLRHGDAEPET